MATNNYNIQLTHIEDAQQHNLYPVSKSSNIQVIPQNNIPSSATNAQAVFDNLGEMAFNDGDDMVYLGESDEGFQLPSTSEIDDSQISLVYTWSSQKIEDSLNRTITLEFACEDSDY